MSIILNSEKLDTIVKIIELNDELIQYDYKGKENRGYKTEYKKRL